MQYVHYTTSVNIVNIASVVLKIDKQMCQRVLPLTAIAKYRNFLIFN